MEDESKKFSQQLDKWDSYKRGDWRWNERPSHRDLTISLIRGGDVMGKHVKTDLCVLNEADVCMTAMNDFIANGGHHNEKLNIRMPLPVSPGACLKMKRKVQEKINKKGVIIPPSEPEEIPSSPVISNVEFLGEDVFLTSAPYVDEENNDENNNVIIDHEGEGDSTHSSNMLLVVKRHNNFRLRKKELLKQQHTITSTIDTTSDDIADSLSQLVRDRTSSSPPLIPRSSMVVSQSIPRSPLADLVRGCYGQSVCQQATVTNITTSFSTSHHVNTSDDKSNSSSSSSKLQQPEEPHSSHEEQPRQQHDSRRCNGTSTGSDDDAVRAMGYGEDLLRDAEMRMLVLEHYQEDDDEFISKRLRQQHRLTQEVEHDLQNYVRSFLSNPMGSLLRYPIFTTDLPSRLPFLFVFRTEKFQTLKQHKIVGNMPRRHMPWHRSDRHCWMRLG